MHWSLWATTHISQLTELTSTQLCAGSLWWENLISFILSSGISCKIVALENRLRLIRCPVMSDYGRMRPRSLLQTLQWLVDTLTPSLKSDFLEHFRRKINGGEGKSYMLRTEIVATAMNSLRQIWTKTVNFLPVQTGWEKPSMAFSVRGSITHVIH